MNIEDLFATCRRKRVKIDALNLAVGALMVDQTGVVGSGSAATLLANGNAPVMQPNDIILEAAETFIIHSEAGEKLILDR